MLNVAKLRLCYNIKYLENLNILMTQIRSNVVRKYSLWSQTYVFDLTY